jgi:type I restriction enzyme, R subunit
MSDVGQRELPVQDRVVLLFADRLGYRYLGNRQYRPGNSNTLARKLAVYQSGGGTTQRER